MNLCIRAELGPDHQHAVPLGIADVDVGKGFTPREMQDTGDGDLSKEHSFLDILTGHEHTHGQLGHGGGTNHPLNAPAPLEGELSGLVDPFGDDEVNHLFIAHVEIRAVDQRIAVHLELDGTPRGDIAAVADGFKVLTFVKSTVTHSLQSGGQSDLGQIHNALTGGVSDADKTIGEIDLLEQTAIAEGHISDHGDGRGDMNTPQGAAILEHPVGDLGQTLGEDDRLNGKPRKGVDGQGGQGGWDGQPLEGGQAAQSIALNRGDILSDDHIGYVHALAHGGDAHHGEAIVISGDKYLGICTGAKTRDGIARSVLGQLILETLALGHIRAADLTDTVHKVVNTADISFGLVVGIDEGALRGIVVSVAAKGAGGHGEGKERQQENRDTFHMEFLSWPVTTYF